MANTNLLKTKIEPDIINGFQQKYCCTEIKLNKKDLKKIFMEMEPDMISYDEKKVFYMLVK